MAVKTGISHASVHRVWQAFGLQPHRVETFKLSNDPQFIEKVRDIGRSVLEPTRSGVGFVRRREESDPSSRPHPTPSCPWPRAWHHLALHRPRRGHWQGHGRLIEDIDRLNSRPSLIASRPRFRMSSMSIWRITVPGHNINTKLSPSITIR